MTPAAAVNAVLDHMGAELVEVNRAELPASARDSLLVWLTEFDGQPVAVFPAGQAPAERLQATRMLLEHQATAS